MLEIRDLRAGYGAINVLWDVSLDVAEGKLTTIVGPNGAGKTTLLRAIMGLIQPTRGSITLGGSPLHGTRAWHMAERGMAMVPEGRMVFKDMTVEENLVVGAFPKACRARLKSNLARAYELFPHLAGRRKTLAGSVSGGEAQMLAIARALMSEPRILLIDEPSLGLAPIVVQQLFAMITSLKGERRTIVLVEQNTHMALRIADHVYLMQGGKVVFSRPAPEVSIDELHERYFAR